MLYEIKANFFCCPWLRNPYEKVYFIRIAYNLNKFHSINLNVMVFNYVITFARTQNTNE